MKDDAPGAGLPNLCEIGVCLRCHDYNTLSIAGQRTRAIQVIYVHNNDARDSGIGLRHQVNLMHAVPQKEITERMRLLRIA